MINNRIRNHSYILLLPKITYTISEKKKFEAEKFLYIVSNYLWIIELIKKDNSSAHLLMSSEIE